MQRRRSPNRPSHSNGGTNNNGTPSSTRQVSPAAQRITLSEADQQRLWAQLNCKGGKGGAAAEPISFTLSASSSAYDVADDDEDSYAGKKGAPSSSSASRRHALYGKVKYILVGMALTVGYSFQRYAPPLRIPSGYDVDDGARPGVAFDKSLIKVKRPVVLVPGFMNSVLEVWDHDPCADEATEEGDAIRSSSDKETTSASTSSSARLFRERLLGPQMLLMLLRNPQCFFKHLALSRTVYGGDPRPTNTTPTTTATGGGAARRHALLRPLSSIDSGDYIIPGYWAWAKIIRSLADVGYDPNSMALLAYDYRLNPALAEARDGHFHKMRMHIEELYRLNGNTKVVLIAHSYGGIMTTAFLNWAEEQHQEGSSSGEGSGATSSSSWIDTYVHAFTTIGSPMLGTPKVVSALISGEISTTAFLPEPMRALVDLHLPRSWRTDTFRTLPGTEALFIRGCDAVWPNVVTLFNQSVVLRGSDVYEMMRTLTRDSNNSAMHERFTEKRAEYNSLPHLPYSPNLSVYAFYGANLQTEVGYAMTLEEDRLRIAGLVAKEDRKAMMDKHLKQWFAEGGVDVKAAERAWEGRSEAISKAFGGAPQNANTKKTRRSRFFGAAPTTTKSPATTAASTTAPLDPPEKVKQAVLEIGEAAAKLWSEFLTKGAEAMRRHSEGGAEGLQQLADAFPMGAFDRKQAVGPSDGEGAAADVNAADGGDANDISDDDIRITDVHKQTLHSRLHRAPQGILWREEYLGMFRSGSDLAIDPAVDNVDVLPLMASGVTAATTAATAGAADGPANSNNNAASSSSSSSSSAFNVFIPYRDAAFKKGVKVGPGDATVPLISLGYMARARNGWRRDVGRIVTKEYLDGHTPAMHEAAVVERRQRLKRRRQKQQERDEATKRAAAPAASSGRVAAGEGLLAAAVAANKGSGDGASSSEKSAEEVFNEIKANFLSAVDMRGGSTSADHVDLLGNYELIADLLMISTGNDAAVSDRILSDIDERVEESRCR